MQDSTTLSEFQQWRLTQLAPLGGFSHRYLARIVFNKSELRVTEEDVDAVRKFCRNKKLKVTEWRNGHTAEARAFVASKLRRRRMRVVAA